MLTFVAKTKCTYDLPDELPFLRIPESLDRIYRT